MEIVKIIITLVFFVLVLVVLQKKVNFAIAMTLLGLAGMLVGSLLNGTSPLGEKTTGVLFFDLFEFFRSSGLIDTITGPGMNMLTILGYIAYMNHLKASTLFALLASRPITKVKNKYLLVWLTFIFSAFLILVIPSGNGRIALMFGTIYPILLACGVSKATATTVIFSGVMYLFGPTAATIYIGAGYMGYDTLNLAEHFVQTEWVFAFSAILVGSVVLVITSRFFDKRENAEGGEAEYGSVTVESLGIPKYYALLPLLPLVLMIIFSGLFAGLPVLSAPTVMLMCFTVVFLFIVAISKKKSEALNDGFVWFKSLGHTLTNVISIVVGGILFGQGIMQIGGVSLLIESFLNTGSSINLPLFVVLSTITAVIIGAVTANNYVPMSILGPAYKAIISASGASPELMIMALCNVPQFSVGMSPASSHIALANQGSGVAIPTILKRSFLPLISAAAVYVIGISILI